jgi:C-terminal processing protease CtpA/Prc
LSHKPFQAGVYLTRRWNDSNKTIPRSEDYQKLFSGFTGKDFKPDGLYKDPGRVLNIVPGKNTFQGKVYVLADGKSSKVAEMLIYTLKIEKIATIIGQKTAGITFFSENLMINDEFDLILPDSDFYTSDGKNLNSVGVEPDIAKSGDEAMNYVLSLI